MSADLKISQMTPSAARPAAAAMPWVGGTPVDNYKGTLLDITGIYHNFTAGDRALAAVPTAGWAPEGGVYFVVTGDTIYPYVVKAGTDAQSVPDVIRPSDYAPTTNEVIYKLLTIQLGGVAVGDVTLTDSAGGAILAANGSGNRNVTLTPTGASGAAVVNGSGILTLDNGTNQATYRADGTASYTAGATFTPASGSVFTVALGAAGRLDVTNTSGPNLRLSNAGTAATINLDLYSTAANYGRLAYLPNGGANDGLNLIDARPDAQAKVLVTLQAAEVARFVAGNLLLGTATNVAGTGNLVAAGGTVTAGAAATNLTLAGGNSGATIALGAGPTGNITLTPVGSSANAYITKSSGNSYLYLQRATAGQGQVALQLGGGTGGTDWIIYQDIGGNNLDIFGNSANRARFTTTGNLLVGGTTDISGSGGVYTANGLEVPNNIAVRLRNSSGTAINTLKMDTSNNLEVVAAGGGDIELFANGGTLGSNAVKVMNTTASTSTTTGALQVAGGVGIAGAVFTGGSVNIGVAANTGTMLNISAADGNNDYAVRILQNSVTSSNGLYIRTKGTRSTDIALYATSNDGTDLILRANNDKSVLFGGNVSITGNFSVSGTGMQTFNGTLWPAYSTDVTAGADLVRGRYSNSGLSSIVTLGAVRSTGDAFLGYGVKAATSGTDYLSSHAINLARAVVQVGGTVSPYIIFLTGAQQTSTDGGAVTLAEAARISAGGAITLGSASSITAASATNLTLAGGSSGASLVLGQGASGGVLITPKGTAGVSIGADTTHTLTPDSSGLVYKNGGVARSVLRSTGSFATLATAGGWEFSYGYRDSTNTTYLGGFGAGGTADTVSHYFIGNTSNQLRLINSTGNLLIGGTTDISGSGGLKVFGTTAVTTTSASGSLQVAGGAGIGAGLFVSGSVSREGLSAAAIFSDTTDSTEALFVGVNSTSNFAWIAASDAGVDWLPICMQPTSGYVTIGGNGASATVGSGGLKVFGSAASTSTTTGALQVAGGVGVQGALWVAGTARFVGAGLLSNGSLSLGATYAGIGGGFQVSFDSPITRIFYGDGTGFDMRFSTRASSTTIDRFTFSDTGGLTMTGNLTVSGTGTSTFAGVAQFCGDDKLSTGWVSASDQYILSANYLNNNGAESVTNNARGSWRQTMRIAGTTALTWAWRAAAAGAGTFTDVWGVSSSGNGTLAGNLTVSGTGSHQIGGTAAIVGVGGAANGSYGLRIFAPGSTYNTNFYSASATTSHYNSSLISGAMTTAIGYFGIGGSTVGNASFQDAFVVGTQSAHPLRFNTNDQQRVEISSAGNVTMTGNLVVNGSSGITSAKGFVSNDAPASGISVHLTDETAAAIRFTKSNATARSFQLTVTDNFTLEDVTAGTAPIVVTGGNNAVALAGNLTVNGAGPHVFSGNIGANRAVNGAVAVYSQNVNTGSTATAYIQATNGAYQTTIEMPGTAYTTSGPRVANRGYVFSDGSAGMTVHAVNGSLRFWTANPGTERMVIDHTTGNVSIASTTASTSTTTGALQVAGGVGVQGAGYFGDSVTLQRSSSNSVTLNLNQIGVVQWYLRNNATTGVFTIGNGSADPITIATGATPTVSLSNALSVGGNLTVSGGTALFEKTGADSLLHIRVNSDTYNPVIRLEGFNRSMYMGVRDNGSDGTFNVSAISALTSPILTLDPATNLTTLAGNLTVSGTGTSTFAGDVTASSGFGVGVNASSTTPFRYLTNTDATTGSLFVNNSTGTSANVGAIYQNAAGTQLVVRAHPALHSTWPNMGLINWNGTGGLVLSTTVAGPVDLYTNAVLRLRVEAAGGLTLGSVSTITAASATNLTLAGGSSGASLVLGQGTNGAFLTGSGQAVGSRASLVVGSATSINTFAVGFPKILAVDDTYSSIGNIACNNINGNHGIYLAGKSRGTQASPLAVADTDVLGDYSFVAYDGAAWRSSASIRATINGAAGAGDLPTRLEFGVAADGSGSPTYRMYLTPAGNLLIGGTTDISGSGGLKVFGTTASTSTTTGALQVAGGVGVAGSIFAGGKFAIDTSTSFVTLSATGARLEANTTWGGVLAGYGTTNDVSIFNKSGVLVMSVPTGTTNATLAGNLTVSGTGTSTFAGTLGIQSASAAYGSGVGQLYIRDATTPTKRLFMGYDTTLDGGYIVSEQTGVTNKSLYIQPGGGGTTVGGNLTVSGTTGIQLAENAFLYFGSSVRTAVKGHSTGSLELYSNNVLAATFTNANATLAGNLTVSGTGASIIAGDLTVSGGNVGIGESSNSARGLSIGGSNTSGIDQYGALINQIVSSSGTTSGQALFLRLTTSAASFTVTNGYGLHVSTPSVGASSAISTLRGIYVDNQGAAGVTNAYGIDIAAQSGAATTNVGLRNAGTTLLTNNSTATSTTTGALVVTGGAGVGGSMHLGGSFTMETGLFALGTPVDSGYGMRIRPTYLSTTTQIGAEIAPTVQTSATNSGVALSLRLITPASSFTMTSGTGIFINSPTVGASSNVTTMRGISVQSQGATGVTTAYGIDIAEQFGAGTNIGLRNAGTTLLTNATNSTSTSSGALVVTGGVGIGGAINVNNDATVGGTFRVAATAAVGGAGPYNTIALAVESDNLTSAGQTGLYAVPVFNSSATTNGYAGQFGLRTSAASFTMVDGRALSISAPIIGAGSSVTTASGIYVSNQGAAGITNAYGLDIAAQSGAATTNIGLRNAGLTRLTNTTASDSTSTGSLTVSGGVGVAGSLNVLGPSSIGGTYSASAGLWIASSTLSGTTQYGLVSAPVFTTAATVSGRCMQIQFTTAASTAMTFGISTYIEAPNFGSGTTVTSMYGISVQNQGRAGVTNAYGVYIAGQSGAATVNVGLYNAGTTILNNTTPSTSATTGALTVAGGVGVDGTVWADAFATTISSVSYSATTNLDFAHQSALTLSLTGNVTFTTSNLLAGRGLRLRIICDGTQRTLSFPGWTWRGGAAPANLAANSEATLMLFSWGTTDADVEAAYAAEA